MTWKWRGEGEGLPAICGFGNSPPDRLHQVVEDLGLFSSLQCKKN